LTPVDAWTTIALAITSSKGVDAMPITRSKQSWTIGSTVRVGFLSLKVTALIPTPGDGMPDIYKLENPSSGAQYEFTPHYGIERIN
jgi:hypothetical protein